MPEECPECPVCFEFTDHRLDPCGHLMCASCMQRWRKGTCPICRRLAENVKGNGNDSRLRVLFYPGMFKGRRIIFSEEGEGVRFRWKWTTPEFVRAYPMFLQQDDIITHIDGFEVEGVERAALMFKRLMSTSCVLTCHVVQRPSYEEFFKTRSSTNFV